jgi:hypothetical protein
MKWIVLALFVVACLFFAVGRWTRITGRSADERAGSDIAYLIGAVLLVLDVLLLVGWAIAHLFF